MALEERLAETEAALFKTLANLQSMKSPADEQVLAVFREFQAHSRAEKQATWQRAPLRTEKARQAWFLEIQKQFPPENKFTTATASSNANTNERADGLDEGDSIHGQHSRPHQNPLPNRLPATEASVMAQHPRYF